MRRGCDPDGSGRATGGEEAGVGRQPRAGDESLRALVEESGVSHKGLARRVVELGAARGLRGLAYDHSSVARWLAGEQPREPVPELIADVLAGRGQRRLSIADVGMGARAGAAGVGLTLAGSSAARVAGAATPGGAGAYQCVSPSAAP